MACTPHVKVMTFARGWTFDHASVCVCVPGILNIQATGNMGWPISETFYMFTIKILQNTFWSHVINNYLVRAQFCTCHDSLAAMTCAKLWHDWVTRIQDRGGKFSQDSKYKLINCLWYGIQEGWSSAGSLCSIAFGPWIRWLTFCRCNFEMQFLELKILYLD